MTRSSIGSSKRTWPTRCVRSFSGMMITASHLLRNANVRLVWLHTPLGSSELPAQFEPGGLVAGRQVQIALQGTHPDDDSTAFTLDTTDPARISIWPGALGTAANGDVGAVLASMNLGFPAAGPDPATRDRWASLLGRLLGRQVVQAVQTMGLDTSLDLEAPLTFEAATGTRLTDPTGEFDPTAYELLPLSALSGPVVDAERALDAALPVPPAFD